MKVYSALNTALKICKTIEKSSINKKHSASIVSGTTNDTGQLLCDIFQKAKNAKDMHIQKTELSKVLPIKNNNECKLLIQKACLDADGKVASLNFNKLFPDAPIEYWGLNHYTGGAYIDINRITSGRNILIPSHLSKVINNLRLFEYSLNSLDKEFGKYSGIVYRAGYFSPKTQQYYSASSNIDGIRHFLESEKDISIIKTKKAHNVNAFYEKYIDKSYRKGYLANEKEIIIDKNSKFREVTDKDENIRQEKMKLAEYLLKVSKERFEMQQKLGCKNVQPMYNNINEIINKIKVYEEV